MALLDPRGRALQMMCMILATGPWLRAHGEVPTPDEYRVKAAFLYNFAKFVEWPPQTFRSPGDGLAVCVFGQSLFGSALEDTVAGKTIGGRAFVVRQVADIQQASGCQILFVGSSERQRFRSLSQDFKSAGVLTVGKSPGFATNDGIVNFKLEDGKVRFEVNVEAADRAKLRISSKLLSLAQIVKKP